MAATAAAISYTYSLTARHADEQGVTYQLQQPITISKQSPGRWSAKASTTSSDGTLAVGTTLTALGVAIIENTGSEAIEIGYADAEYVMRWEAGEIWPFRLAAGATTLHHKSAGGNSSFIITIEEN